MQEHPDDTVDRTDLETAVRRINPAWRVHTVERATGGYHHVSHLELVTPDGKLSCVLKATPSDQPPVCGDEARLLTILAEQGAPVPTVLGVIDEDEGLPSPLFLAEEVPGRNYRRAELRTLSTGELKRIARSLGRRLATVHDVADDSTFGLPGYGVVSVEPADTCAGDRPNPTHEQVTVSDLHHSWPEYLAASAAQALDALRETRFDELADSVANAVEARIDALAGASTPVLCRVDHSIENTVVDAETGEVGALLDWEFCVAATPAYDIAFAVDSLNGGLRALVPDFPDREASVRSGLLCGYAEVGDERVVQQYRENGDCYHLLSDLHGMCQFEAWFEQAATPPSQREAAVEPLKNRVKRRL